jgi:hypothetical protein
MDYSKRLEGELNRLSREWEKSVREEKLRLGREITGFKTAITFAGYCYQYNGSYSVFKFEGEKNE